MGANFGFSLNSGCASYRDYCANKIVRGNCILWHVCPIQDLKNILESTVFLWREGLLHTLGETEYCICWKVQRWYLCATAAFSPSDNCHVKKWTAGPLIRLKAFRWFNCFTVIPSKRITDSIQILADMFTKGINKKKTTLFAKTLKRNQSTTTDVCFYGDAWRLGRYILHPGFMAMSVSHPLKNKMRPF